MYCTQTLLLNYIVEQLGAFSLSFMLTTEIDCMNTRRNVEKSAGDNDDGR